jgi:hypothetical protein
LRTNLAVASIKRDRLGDGDGTVAGAIDGRDLAASICNIDSMLKGFTRRPECALIGVISIRSYEEAGRRRIGVHRVAERDGERVAN